MDTPTDPHLAGARQSLHAVAETVLAGHQHRVAGTIRLAVVPGGFATLPLPGEPDGLAVRGTDLVVSRSGGEHLVPLRGTLRAVAEAAGIGWGPPAGVYADGTGAGPDDELVLDAAAVATVLDGLAIGDAALRRFGASVLGAEAPVPVLWPEHFDVGISADGVNYGTSAGDGTIPEPYAYVGPWQPRTGDFWDRPFGAARTVRELGGVDAMVAFFEAGRAHAATDPSPDPSPDPEPTGK